MMETIAAQFSLPFQELVLLLIAILLPALEADVLILQVALLKFTIYV